MRHYEERSRPLAGAFSLDGFVLCKDISQSARGFLISVLWRP